MTILFQWSDEYSVGDADIDNQHKMIIEIANSLNEELSVEEVKAILLKLVHHSKDHFLCEEKMMESMDYPDLEEHRKLHTEMVTTLADFCLKKYESPEEVHEFRKFVYNWIIDHLLHHDKKLFRFVQEKRPPVNDGFDLTL